MGIQLTDSQRTVGGQSSGDPAAPAYGQWEEPGLLQRAVLHGPKHLRLAEHQAASAQLLVQSGPERLRLHRPVGTIVANVADELAHSDFAPLAFELGFGEGKAMPAVTIRSGDAELTARGLLTSTSRAGRYSTPAGTISCPNTFRPSCSRAKR